MKRTYKSVRRSYDVIITRVFNLIIAMIFKGKYACGKNARFAGVPKILPLAGIISLGDNARLSSRLLSNLLGVNHPVIMSTIEMGKIKIGNDFHISGGSIISRKSIIIGDDVFIGANCLITDSDHHEIDYKRRRLGQSTKIKTSEVKIGNDVWIGANVTILKGVTIGSRSIVGAGLTVSRSIPEDHMLTQNGLKKTKNGK
jgi:acetyltransferase-like isoleucine patch superfamily enzyme